jgi:hypothetical protein
VELKERIREKNCRVAVHWQFIPKEKGSKEGKFVRKQNINMQHSHPLILEERILLKRDEIMDDIKLYLQCGLQQS